MNIADPHALSEIALRLGAAMLSGAVLGVDRDLHEKPAGMRTLALVSTGSAMIVMTAVGDMTRGTVVSDPEGRIIQGIFAGIGFLGGGVILHHTAHNAVFGLTTAATIWVTAAIGVAWGLGLWQLALITLGLAAAILIPGVWIENWIRRRFKPKPNPHVKKPAADER
jgi:putative Mg2+ transporter-C (MgtC) family protein